MSNENKDQDRSNGETHNKMIDEIRRKNPKILFVIIRSKNLNIVVYEAIFGPSDKLNSSKPLDAYWLDVDPAYVSANRKKGIMHDRSELNLLENNFAYGLNHSAHPHKNHHYIVKLVAVPDLELTVFIDDDNKAHATIDLDGCTCKLNKIYVHSVERTLRLPKVMYIDIYATSLDGSSIKSKRLTPP